MKVQGFGLVRNFLKINKKKLFDSRCKTMRIEMVSNDVGVGENVVKVYTVLKYSFACPRTKLWKMCL
jgi:hypothetical protein